MYAVLTILVVVGAVALAAFEPSATMTAIATTVMAALLVEALKQAWSSGSARARKDEGSASAAAVRLGESARSAWAVALLLALLVSGGGGSRVTDVGLRQPPPVTPIASPTYAEVAPTLDRTSPVLRTTRAGVPNDHGWFPPD